MSKRQKFIDMYLDSEDQLLFLEPDYFDEAIIGIAQRADSLIAVCYSEPKVLELLMEHDGMDADEAMEWYQFNILGAYVGESTPIFIDDSEICK